MELSRNHFQRNSSWNAPYSFSGKEQDADKNGQYDEGEYISHSAVEITVDVDGNTTTVISKLGASEISENHPDAAKFYKRVRDYNNRKIETQS